MLRRPVLQVNAQITYVSKVKRIRFAFLTPWEFVVFMGVQLCRVSIMGILDRLKKKTQTINDVVDFIEIPVENIIKESRIETPEYCDKNYIIYSSPGDARMKIRVNTYYLLQGKKVRLCTHYDRGLCDTLEEYNRLPEEYIRKQVYCSWMDGAR